MKKHRFVFRDTKSQRRQSLYQETINKDAKEARKAVPKLPIGFILIEASIGFFVTVFLLEAKPDLSLVAICLITSIILNIILPIRK